MSTIYWELFKMKLLKLLILNLHFSKTLLTYQYCEIILLLIRIKTLIYCVLKIFFMFILFWRHWGFGFALWILTILIFRIAWQGNYIFVSHLKYFWFEVLIIEPMVVYFSFLWIHKTLISLNDFHWNLFFCL